MEEEKVEEEQTILWVDEDNKIISFHHEDGFEPVYYHSHEEKIQHALTMTIAGYSVQ